MQAACAVAQAHGLTFAEPASIGAASNVLVHLSPAPVVARVMTATAVLHPDVQWWLERELEVGRFLAERSAPIVPPTDLLDPGPHEHDGYWMTFWMFVDHDPGRRLESPGLLGRSLRELHAMLADFQGSLPTLTSVADSLAHLLNELQPSARLKREQLEAMNSELERLRPLVFETALPVQALHGDASLSNLLHAEGGLLWNDLEDVCEGPVEWDLASLVVSMRDRGASSQFVDAVLRAYGASGVERLAQFVDAHALYGTVWQAFQARTSPSHAV
jgi:Phosphotransferase enzyme family